MLKRRPASLTGLWRHPEFMKLWAGQAVSQFGSMVTRDALPLIGVLALRASPLQMGLLSAASFAPVLVVGLLAGVWVDRLRRRPILILADLGRAALVLSIPVAALLGRLTIGQLYLVGALAGTLSVFFNVAYQAYLPTLVAREHVLEGNSKLSLTDSLAEIVVPGLTGLLVQLITGPLTLLFGGFSYLVSSLSLGLIRAPEPAPRPATAETASVRHGLRAGLGVVLREPLLRALVASTSWRDFFGSFYGALYSLYAIDVLHFSPALLGVIIAAGGLGSLLGAGLVRRFTRRLGLGPALVWALVLTGVLGVLTPLARGPLWLAAACLFIPQLFGDLFRTIYTIGELSLRQALTPDRLLGRVSASVHFFAGGVTTFGLLAGGALAEVIGIRPAVWVAAIGSGLAAAWLLASPVRTLRAQHAPIEEG